MAGEVIGIGCQGNGLGRINSYYCWCTVPEPDNIELECLGLGLSDLELPVIANNGRTYSGLIPPPPAAARRPQLPGQPDTSSLPHADKKNIITVAARTEKSDLVCNVFIMIKMYVRSILQLVLALRNKRSLFSRILAQR